MALLGVKRLNYLNKKLYIWIFVIISISVYLIASLFFPILESSLFGYFRLISIVVTIDGIFIWLFTKYFWKWHLLYDWLVPFPNLNGIWKGELISTWKDPNTGQAINPIPTTLTIKQSFLSIHCVMRTKDINSESLVCSFDIDKDRQKLKLIYSYDGNPKLTVRDKSPRHFGTAMFDIEVIKNKKLIGSYWTDRKTTGEINLCFFKKERLDGNIYDYLENTQIVG